MFTAINLVKLWQKGFYVHLNVSSQPTLKEPTSGYCRCREFNVTLTSETILALLQLVFDLWRQTFVWSSEYWAEGRSTRIVRDMLTFYIKTPTTGRYHLNPKLLAHKLTSPKLQNWLTLMFRGLISPTDENWLTINKNSFHFILFK